MSKAQHQRLLEQRAAMRQAERKRPVPTVEVEQRVRGVRLVQLAAWTRSWRLLEWAVGRVRIEQRYAATGSMPASPWHPTEAKVEVDKAGNVRLQFPSLQ